MATSTDLRSAIQEVQGQLPAEQVRPEYALPLDDGDWAGRLERRVGALPWWVISAATHAVLFLLVALLATAVAPPKSDEVIISTDIVKQKPPEYDPQKKRDIFKNTKEVQAEALVENPVVTHEKMEESDHFETDNNMDKNTSRGQEDAISDIPLGGTGTVGSIGVGGGGMAGVFGYRDGGGRKKAVGRFGGSQATESSVEAALRWLSRHQEADGHWDTQKYMDAPDNFPRDSFDPGITGLALLAFLGAGYTHKDKSLFQDNVLRAVKWLASNQKADGTFTQKKADAHWQYNEFICCLAVSEAYGMSRDPWLKEIAQKSVDYLVANQTPYSGWRYTPKADSDTSVVGWATMALKSAKMAGLKVDGAAFQGINTYLDKVTEKGADGKVEVTYHPEERISSGFEQDTRCTTAIGMLCRQFMGARQDDPLVVGSGKFLAGHLPEWAEGKYHFYYWYYATLAVFQQGGPEWNRWNEAIKKTLVDHQCKGPVPLTSGPEDKDGSWDPKCYYGARWAGRVYTTALGALTLEIYYRYLPMYAK
jgi:hypothetical protein